MNADARRSKKCTWSRRTAVCYESVAAVEIGPEVALRLAKQLECKYPQRRTGLVIGHPSEWRSNLHSGERKRVSVYPGPGERRTGYRKARRG